MSFDRMLWVDLDHRWKPVGRVITTVQLHHTWIPNYSHFKHDNHIALQESMDRNAKEERGFSEIAQHFTVFPDGYIVTGRSLEISPAGIKGANTGAICIEVLGNFDVGNDVMTDLQKEAVVQLTAFICAKEIGAMPDKRNVVYHHWFDLGSGKRTGGVGSTKSCPGTAFFGGNTEADFDKNLKPLLVEAYNKLQPAR
jgi:hypothetical protein